MADWRGFAAGLAKGTAQLPEVALKKRAQEAENLQIRRKTMIEGANLAIGIGKEYLDVGSLGAGLATLVNNGVLDPTFPLDRVLNQASIRFTEQGNAERLQRVQDELKVEELKRQNDIDSKWQQGGQVHTAPNGMMYKIDASGAIIPLTLPEELTKGFRTVYPELGWGIDYKGDQVPLPRETLDVMHEWAREQQGRTILKVDMEGGQIIFENGSRIPITPETMAHWRAGQKLVEERWKTRQGIAHGWSMKVQEFSALNGLRMAQFREMSSAIQTIGKELIDGRVSGEEAMAFLRTIWTNPQADYTNQDKDRLESTLSDLISLTITKVPTSVGERKELQELDWAVVASENVVNMLEENPDLLNEYGWLSGRWTKVDEIVFGGKYHAAKNPEAVRFNTYMAHIKDQALLRPRSGAAVNPEEEKFYNQLVGNPISNAESFKLKLATFAEYSRNRRQMLWTTILMNKYGSDTKGLEEAIKNIPAIAFEMIAPKLSGGGARPLTLTSDGEAVTQVADETGMDDEEVLRLLYEKIDQRLTGSE